VTSEEYASIAAMLKQHALIGLCRSRELLRESLGTALCEPTPSSVTRYVVCEHDPS
jgi:hypothetical protein